MNMMAVVTLIRKEWAELYKNTYVLLTVFFLPLTFVALPLVILWATGDYEGTTDIMTTELPPQMAQLCEGLGSGACMQVFIASQFLLLFMMVPLIIPATLAPYSIVGEKTQRTLEPLLATPIRTEELLLGKNLAATIPAVLATWLAFGLFLVGARLLVRDALAFARLLELRWLLAVFVLGPLLALLSVNLAIMVSARSNDPRVAQQITSLIVFPLLFIFLGQLIGWFYLSQTAVIVGTVIVLALDLGLAWVAIRVFDRETILTRWS